MKNQKPVGKYEISPYNAELMKMMGKFVSQVENAANSANGVYFNENVVLASDEHCALLIKNLQKAGTNIIKGSFTTETMNRLAVPKLQYKELVARTGQSFFAEIGVKDFTDALKIARPNINDCDYNVLLSFNADKVTITSANEKRKKYFNASFPCRSSAEQYSFQVNETYLTFLLGFFEEYGVEKIKICSDFFEDWQYYRNSPQPVLIRFNTPFGETIVIIKVHFGNDFYNKDEKIEEILRKNVLTVSSNKDLSPMNLKYYFETDEKVLEIKAQSLYHRFNNQINSIVDRENYENEKIELMNYGK